MLVLVMIMFFSMVLSIMKNYKNLFIILLSLEMGVLGFLTFLTSLLPYKFVLMIFVFVMSSVLGLILFLYTVKIFSSVLSSSWYF